eukprot:CAMPEP_0174832372 /NCGR_PEP_ID=MMETSP1114-20130205/3643_1 /TAXON_ID=312471 /ORGANISM="Neobodo designis, Strain CCAP 1951/1" /LENGTH=482 /DNA_ID=CAMNT_0016066231 /DNA_START=35 /DNA_END=1483 /DNA_ORIENTATION=+
MADQTAATGNMFSGPLTVYKLPRLVAAGSSAVAMAALHQASPVAGIIGGVGLVASAAAQYAVHTLFPLEPVRRFADVPRDRWASCHDQHNIAELLHEQRYHVGMRHLPGERGTRPHVTVFYPTDTAPCDGETPCYVPFADPRFSKGFTDYGRAPAFVGAHHVDIRMHMTRNASLAKDAAGNGAATCKLGSKEHPIVLFSHGLAGHQHMYAAYAADLAANGAVVLALQHTDGSAAFALEQPEGTTDGEVVPAARQEPITYRAPPPSGTDAELEFRQTQLLRKRVPELQHVMRFVAAGRLHDALHCPAGSFAAQYTAKKRPVPIALIGHSFGGATVVAASALHPPRKIPTDLDGPWMTDLRKTVTVSACVSLDCWAYAVHPWLQRTLDGAAGPLPPLAFHDSQHWERWSSNKRELEDMVGWWQNTGAVATRTHKLETDHLTLSVISSLVNFKRMRRGYTMPHKDRLFAAEWAHEALAHVRNAGF